MEDDNEDIGAIKETNVGRIEPGQSVTKSIYLHGGNVTGSRLINITVSNFLFPFFFLKKKGYVFTWNPHR